MPVIWAERDGKQSNAALALVLLASRLTLAAEPEKRPYSCRLFDDERRKSAFGSCDRQMVERLRKGRFAGRRPAMISNVDYSGADRRCRDPGAGPVL